MIKKVAVAISCLLAFANAFFFMREGIMINAGNLFVVHDATGSHTQHGIVVLYFLLVCLSTLAVLLAILKIILLLLNKLRHWREND